MDILVSISSEFQKYNIDKNGIINTEEFKAFIKEIKMNNNLTITNDKSMFEQLDTNYDE
ncbi:hypothetical protein PIROE2DRAFT_10528 [Piromyces sp. E2]|nr:hypothetical protein PIROE2DRAFT_10528 [Piromyces sp. E2]|eukprot:OUM63056.1 hypothetical protein PIROE2DRAFT_10528 [Piromyces sp. E2]